MTASKIESETQTFFHSPNGNCFGLFIYFLSFILFLLYTLWQNRHPSIKSDKQRSQRHSTNGLVCRERIRSLRFARVDRLFVRSGQTIVWGENDAWNKEIIIFEENTVFFCCRKRKVKNCRLRTFGRFREVVSATDLFWFWYHMEPTCLQTIEWFNFYFSWCMTSMGLWVLLFKKKSEVPSLICYLLIKRLEIKLRFYRYLKFCPEKFGK